MKLETDLNIINNWATVPTVTLSRNGKIVVLIGMLHIASRDFFESVMVRLKKYEENGFQILYEEVEAIPSADLKDLRLLLNALESYGLYGQLDVININSTWQTADVVFEKDKIDSNNSIQDDFNKDDLRDPKKFIQNILLPQLEDSSIMPPNVEKVINERNKYAISSVLKYVKHSNVATYWGCSHLPGMIGLLESDGFVLDKIEWTQAIDLAKLKLIN